MADGFAMSLLGVMDQLWFHGSILFSQPSSNLLPFKMAKLPLEQVPFSEFSSMASVLEDQEILTINSSTSFTPLQYEYSSGKEEEIEFKEPLTKQTISTSKPWSHSLSPSTQKRSRELRDTSPVIRRLQKTTSCKTFQELEDEEVKGFINLGFTFEEENLCPRMMSVVPGLQRLGGCHKNEGGEVVKRPYLSEAWLIGRPDSPLLNLRVPKVSRMADMKKHLMLWARTVASHIHQES